MIGESGVPRLFNGSGKAGFERIPPGSLDTDGVIRGMWIDYDHDGDVDLVALNEVTEASEWL